MERKRASASTKDDSIVAKRGKSAPEGSVAISCRSNLLAVQLDFNVPVVDCNSDQKIKVIADIKKSGTRQHYACLDRTGERLATINTIGFLQIWSTETTALLKEIKTPVVDYSHGYCCFNPSLNQLAFIVKRTTDEGNETITLWDIDSGEKMLTLAGHTEAVLSIDYSPDGTTLISASYDRTIRLWDVVTGSLLNTLSHADQVVAHVSFSKDGSKLVSCAADNTLKIWDVPSMVCSYDYKSKYYVFEAMFNSDCSKLILRYQYKLQVIDLMNDNQVVFTADKCKMFSLHSNGTNIAIVDKTSVGVWDFSSGQLLHTVTFPKSACLKSVCFFPPESSSYLLK